MNRAKSTPGLRANLELSCFEGYAIAFEGRKGGVLSACDKTDGKTLWDYKLPSPPVFNGLVAANGRLYVAMQDGSIACFSK